MSLKCPIHEICVTPVLYGATIRMEYVKQVCSTDEYFLCTYYNYGLHPKKNSKEWKRIIAWLAKRKKELEHEKDLPKPNEGNQP